MEEEQRTRSNADGKRFIRLLPVFIVLAVSILACSNGYLSEAELAATANIPLAPRTTRAVKQQSVARVPNAVITITPSPTDEPTPEAVPSADVPDLWVDQVIPTEAPTGEVTETAVVPVIETTAIPSLEIPTQVTGEPVGQPTLMLPVYAAAAAPAETGQTPPILYYTQAGDTLPALAVRFRVDTKDIYSADKISMTGLLDPNILLVIPSVLKDTTSNKKLMPDSETVFSPSGLDLNIDDFVNQAGGYLSTYREYLGSTGWSTGAEVVKRIAVENSINPRLLLSILEYKSHWVYGYPTDEQTLTYPMGFVDSLKKGLYQQLALAISDISLGYYGWREGWITDIPFTDGTFIRPSPELNAGTVAVQYLFAKLYPKDQWNDVLYGKDSFSALHEKMFGSPWLRAQMVEPLFPTTLAQPDLQLPFEIGKQWSLTGGPHSAWGPEGALAALDFAPNASASGCTVSDEWAVAAEAGIIVRADHGAVVLDLDGDGNEQTGWDILYMHIATRDRPQVGMWLEKGDKLGHPSCEGGISTGTHFHMARKYNGEWIFADGPIPYNLDGWIAHAGSAPYIGTLNRGNEVVTASQYGIRSSVIVRSPDGQ